MSVLTLSKVCYHYEGTKKMILNNVSMDLELGKVYIIMGKSGTGKSTLLSLVSGLDLPTKGDIFYNQKNLKQIDRDDYRANSIGVVFQGYNLLTNATALENIIISMNISKNNVKNKKKLALEYLQKVGIDEEMANRKVLKLSGGEQQRVGIARALSHNPDIIIADEPSGNLDSETEKNIMDILHMLAHEENKCIFVVTHSKQVSKYADELWGINQGNLVFVK